MSTFYATYPIRGGSGSGVATYPTFADLPASAADGTLAVTLDTDDLYVFNAASMMWLLLSTPGGEVNAVGAFDTQAPSANAAVISGSGIFFQSASVSVPGMVNNTTQSFSGNKTFTGTIGASNLSGTNTGDLTLGAVGSSPNANAASLSGQVLTLQPFNSSFPGVVSASGGGTTNFLRADGTWATPAGAGTVTSVALADSTGTFTVTGSPVTGSGTLTLSAFASQTANTFLAAPNGGAGAPTFRTILASDVPTLNQNTSGSAASLSATLVTGSGGTGLTTYTTGDILYASATNTLSKLGIGSTNQVLTVISGIPSWQTPSASAGFAYLSSNTSVYGGTNTTLSFTGADNSVIGISAGNALTSGHDNTLYGYQAGILLTGNFNTIIGAKAGITQTSGSDNTLIGYQAGTLATGSDNTIIGYQAGNHVSTGGSNTIIGSFAGQISTTSSNNTVIGQASGGGMSATSNSCTFIGNGAGTSSGSITGNNVAIGNGAGVAGQGSITIGGGSANAYHDFDIIIGYQALAGSTGAAGCISIGGKADSRSTTVPGITIGYSAFTQGVGSIVIGPNSTDQITNNTMIIGHGQANPSTAHTGCFIVGQTTDGSIITNTTGTNQIVFGTSGTHAIPLKDMFLGRGSVGDATATNVSIQPSPTVGSNIAGANLTITAGNGTGTGGSGSLIFQTAPSAGSSSTPNTLATVGQVDKNGAWTLGATSTTPTHILNTNSTMGAGVGTFTNVPGAAGNPAGYIQITINGVTSYIPYFQ